MGDPAGSIIWYDERTLVLRAKDLEQMRVFLEGMGLKFLQEQHGTGPIHYACQVGQQVLELYPEQD